MTSTAKACPGSGRFVEVVPDAGQKVECPVCGGRVRPRLGGRVRVHRVALSVQGDLFDQEGR